MAANQEEVSIRTIKQQLKSKNSANRLGALFLLRKYDFPESSTLLKDIIKQDSEIAVREIALLILSEKNESEIASISRKLFYNTTENHFIRGRAIWTLGQVRDVESLKIIKSALDDRKEEVVYWAIMSLLNYEIDDQLLEILRNILLEHRSNLVRYAIVYYFGLIQDFNSIPVLEDRLLNDAFSVVRLQSIWALRQMKSLKSIKALCIALNKERNALTRREIVISIGLILEKQSKDTKFTLDYTVALDLAVESLQKAFTRDIEYIIRRASVEALGRIKDKRVLPVLIEKLALDTNHFVRKEIINTLGKIGDPQALEILLEAQKSQYRIIVEAAKEAIKQLHIV